MAEFVTHFRKMVELKKYLIIVLAGTKEFLRFKKKLYLLHI